MDKKLTFRHMERTPLLEEFALKHLGRLDKLLISERTPIYIEMVLTAAPDHAHQEVELLVKTPHYDLVAHHEGPEMYQEIERVVDTMIKEIKRAKEKFEDDQRTKDTFKSA